MFGALERASELLCDTARRLGLTPREESTVFTHVLDPAHDQRQWHFAHRLRVVAVGAWGTVPQSPVDDLTALGLDLDQTIATLGKVVDEILSTANCCIYRQRHANTAAAPRTAAPRGVPTAP